MSESKYYDVALSFAGEDRAYVEQVAVALDAAGVHVFYDRLEEANLWGKDLYSYLDEIYRRKARYCIVFISEAYGQKLWTNHERESAQARAFESSGAVFPSLRGIRHSDWDRAHRADPSSRAAPYRRG